RRNREPGWKSPSPRQSPSRKRDPRRCLGAECSLTRSARSTWSVMADPFSGKVAVAGVGETDYSRNSGRSELTLSLQAIHAALDDCGLTPKDVDGLLRWQVDTSAEADVAASLGMKELR